MEKHWSKGGSKSNQVYKLIPTSQIYIATYATAKKSPKSWRDHDPLLFSFDLSQL